MNEKHNNEEPQPPSGLLDKIKKYFRNPFFIKTQSVSEVTEFLKDAADQNIIDKVLKNININPKTFFLRASGQSVKNLLRKKTDEAFEKGVFGAPTFLVNNKIFWGQDRLEYAIAEAKK